MKSRIKLYGPRIAEGLQALEDLVKDIRDDVTFERIMTRVDPTLDLMTKQLIADGEEMLGGYDFVIEWRTRPPPKSHRELIKKLDRVLASSGCRYTITTE